MPRLEPGMARIRVKDLRLRTYIGIKEEEINNKQDVLINLTILYPAVDAVEVNDIEHALNYRTITKAIIAHVEGNRFALLERLTQGTRLKPGIPDLVGGGSTLLLPERLPDGKGRDADRHEAQQADDRRQLEAE